MKYYKFLDAGLKSHNGEQVWKIGEWYETKGKLNICNNGFHCSKKIGQAFSYVRGEILALVETKGDEIVQDDKSCHEKMRIVKAWKWQKKDSVAISIFAAELCLENFEKVCPDDKRPREAIEAAKYWLENPTDSAARSAAKSAARSAERSAAWSAERSAAWSAESAVSAAWSAAWSSVSAEVGSWMRDVWRDAREFRHCRKAENRKRREPVGDHTCTMASRSPSTDGTHDVGAGNGVKGGE